MVVGVDRGAPVDFTEIRSGLKIIEAPRESALITNSDAHIERQCRRNPPPPNAFVSGRVRQFIAVSHRGEADEF